MFDVHPLNLVIKELLDLEEGQNALYMYPTMCICDKPIWAGRFIGRSFTTSSCEAWLKRPLWTHHLDPTGVYRTVNHTDWQLFAVTHEWQIHTWETHIFWESQLKYLFTFGTKFWHNSSTFHPACSNFSIINVLHAHSLRRMPECLMQYYPF